MKYLYTKIKSPLIFTIILMMVLPSYVKGESSFKGMPDKKGSIIVNSDMVEINDSKGMVLFSGNVKARSEDFTIQCDRMTLYYRKRAVKGKISSNGVVVERIVAKGGVRIKRKIGGEARADCAEYLSRENKIVLTGNPVVKHGEDFIEGFKITFFLKNNRSIIEGSPESKVKAVFSSPQGTNLKLR